MKSAFSVFLFFCLGLPSNLHESVIRLQPTLTIKRPEKTSVVDGVRFSKYISNVKECSQTKVLSRIVPKASSPLGNYSYILEVGKRNFTYFQMTWNFMKLWRQNFTIFHKISQYFTKFHKLEQPWENFCSDFCGTKFIWKSLKKCSWNRKFASTIFCRIPLVQTKFMPVKN